MTAEGKARGAGAVVCLLAALLAAPGSARAQVQVERGIDELDLEELLNTPIDVWTATKTPQKAYEAPAIITTVTREQIAVWGYRSIAEVLSHLLGFYVVDDHTLPNLAVRGSSGGLYSESSIVKVLINGHSVAFSSTGGNWLGPELIPLSSVERVEIIRGPASALYGADAFLGVINIQTRDGTSVGGARGWVAAGLVGEHGATDVDVALGSAHGPVDVMVGFKQTRQDLSGLPLPASSPMPQIPVYNLDAPRDARGLEQLSNTAIATVTFRPSETTEIGAFGHFAAMDRGAEFGSLFQLANGYNEHNAFSENRVTQWQVHTGALWNQEVRDNLQLSMHAAYFQGAPRQDNRLEVGSEFYYVRREFGFRGVDSDGHVVWTPRPSLRLVGGASFMLDDEELPSRIGIAKQQVEDVRAGEVIEAISKRQGHKTFMNVGAYLQGTWQALGSYLGLTGGLRYDQHNVYGGQLSRRLGVVSSPRPNLHAKLLHGSAFKAPSPLLLYAVPSSSGDVVGNADLQPQYVNTYEFQVVYEPVHGLMLSTDVAYSLLHDKTEFIQQGINKEARNVARAATVSWESMLEAKAREWAQGYVSLELQRTQQRTGQDGYVGQVMGDQGGIYPNIMVHAGVVAQPPGFPLRAAVQSSYVGARRASGNNILLNGGPYTLPAYVLLEANLSTVGFRILRDAAQEVSFSLSGKNLLDASGPNPGFSGVDYPLFPRAFFLQMNLTL